MTNPQSFNRYAYVQNDPVNFVDPTGLCTFNINIRNDANVSSGTLQSMKNEIRRIFGAAGQNVIFNMPRYPDINSNRSYSLTVQGGGSTPGGTDASATYVYNQGRASTDRLRESIMSDRTVGQLGMHPTNFGRALGRVAAHESMHYFQQIFNSGHTSGGLMQAGSRGAEWFSRENNSTFSLSAMQAALLSARCPPIPEQSPIINTNPIPLRPLIGGGGGFGGYPSWWYSMWEFLDWLNSFPVGGPKDDVEHLG